MATIIILGAGVAGIAFAARKILITIGERQAIRNAMGARQYMGPFEAKMDRREARLILNLPKAFDMQQVKDHHRKLIMANHPDQGGSTLLALKINEAKDLLTKELQQPSSFS